MLSHLTASDIANTVRLTRTSFSGAIVITEGDSDILLYKRLCSKTKCRFIPSAGKENAVGAIEILNRTNFTGVMAIVDSDFDRIESSLHTSQDVVYTDTHDLETMILSSSSLAKVLDELLALDSSGRSRQAKFVSQVFQASLPLAYFRWLSSPHRLNLRLKFKGITYTDFIDASLITISIDLMIQCVVTNTSGCTHSPVRLKPQLLALMAQPQDNWQLCSGHDLVEIMYVALKSSWGNRKVRSLTPKVFQSMLRVGYEQSHFANSLLYTSIKDWQGRNPGFFVLG